MKKIAETRQTRFSVGFPRQRGETHTPKIVDLAKAKASLEELGAWKNEGRRN